MLACLQPLILASLHVEKECEVTRGLIKMQEKGLIGLQIKHGTPSDQHNEHPLRVGSGAGVALPSGGARAGQRLASQP